MKILLIDFDSKIPNLALMKISAQAKQAGHTVGFDVQDPNIIHCSVIFSKNKGQAAGLREMFPGKEIIFGGPGWDLKNELPRTIEFVKPDYDLYPSEYSQGFTTRGCIRNCPFCIVPKKEGTIQIWQHPSEFHDDRFNRSVLLDNNLFAASPDWVKGVFNWAIESGVKLDMTQGYDARLLTEEYAGLLKETMPANGVRFSWDNKNDEVSIRNAIKLLKNAGIDLKHKVSFHVIVGYNSSFEDDLYRCNTLRDLGCNSFVMQYHKNNPQLRKLAKWANRRWAYWSVPFAVNR